MWKPSLKQHILNTYSIDYYSNLIKHLLEHHVLYICQHHPDTLQEDIDDVGMEMDRLPIPSSPSLQGETQVDLKIEINNNVKINQRNLNKYHIIKWIYSVDRKLIKKIGNHVQMSIFCLTLIGEKWR